VLLAELLLQPQLRPENAAFSIFSQSLSNVRCTLVGRRAENPVDAAEDRVMAVWQQQHRAAAAAVGVMLDALDRSAIRVVYEEFRPATKLHSDLHKDHNGKRGFCLDHKGSAVFEAAGASKANGTTTGLAGEEAAADLHEQHENADLGLEPPTVERPLRVRDHRRHLGPDDRAGRVDGHGDRLAAHLKVLHRGRVETPKLRYVGPFEVPRTLKRCQKRAC